ncbi:MAG: prolyl-tRNA synthetase associated domain-containing protein [Parvularculaceae bacterium]
MTLSQSDLFDLLDALRVETRTVEHPPTMTVADGRGVKASMPGGHTKNLFLRDKKRSLFLVSAHCDAKIDLASLGPRLGARGRLSFASAEALQQTLGVPPGSVTALALANPGAKVLAGVAFDKTLFDHDRVWFHPLRNDASTAIAPDDLMAFARHCGFAPLVLDLAVDSRA